MCNTNVTSRLYFTLDKTQQQYPVRYFDIICTCFARFYKPSYYQQTFSHLLSNNLTNSCRPLREALLRHILSPLHNLSPAIVATLAAHCVAPVHNLTPGDKMCLSGTCGLGRQNVPRESTHFVVPHLMDLNIHSDI